MLRRLYEEISEDGGDDGLPRQSTDETRKAYRPPSCDVGRPPLRGGAVTDTDCQSEDGDLQRDPRPFAALSGFNLRPIHAMPDGDLERLSVNQLLTDGEGRGPFIREQNVYSGTKVDALHDRNGHGVQISIVLRSARCRGGLERAAPQQNMAVAFAHVHHVTGTPATSRSGG